MVFKIIYHIRSTIYEIILKIIYRSKFKIGKQVTWRKGFSLMISDTGKVIIGDNCFFNNYCSINCIESVVIGEGVIIGENVKIYDHNHIYKDSNAPIKNQGYTKAPVKIGNHCWIGSNVTILKGISIGNNVVVGANCLIYQDIPDNSVVMSSEKLIYRGQHSVE